MLEEVFLELYTKFKLNFYSGIFERLKERESSLTASEAYEVEIIHALRRPTIGQFAEFLQISYPGATYKVNRLISKGYVEKVSSDTDRREVYLYLTPKFFAYCAIGEGYLTTVMRRIRERFTAEEVGRLEEMLGIISRELMPEQSDELTGGDPPPMQD